MQIQKTLENCYRELPDQFSLQETKQNLKRTLDSINQVNKKRHKRKLQEQQNNANLLQFASLDDAKKALAILDQMMQDEQKIIDQANSPSNTQKSNSDEMLLG
jgi:transcription elongation GreA/GreB family factor